jgi:hypothetical protein
MVMLGWGRGCGILSGWMFQLIMESLGQRHVGYLRYKLVLMIMRMIISVLNGCGHCRNLILSTLRLHAH